MRSPACAGGILQRPPVDVAASSSDPSHHIPFQFVRAE
jgi:hypothetical protein